MLKNKIKETEEKFNKIMATIPLQHLISETAINALVEIQADKRSNSEAQIRAATALKTIRTIADKIELINK